VIDIRFQRGCGFDTTAGNRDHHGIYIVGIAVNRNRAAEDAGHSWAKADIDTARQTAVGYIERERRKYVKGRAATAYIADAQGCVAGVFNTQWQTRGTADKDIAEIQRIRADINGGNFYRGINNCAT